jgi:hypothetical protein
MKRSNLIILLISALLIALAYFTLSGERNGTLKNDFLLSDTSNVEKMFLVNKENEQVTLTRENGIWVLPNGEEAIQENVMILLKTMMLIDIRQPVSKSSFNTVVKQLATNSTKVEIYQRIYTIDFLGIKLFPKLKNTKTFYVGDPTRDYKGTIMKMDNSDDIYITYLPGFNGYLSERFSASYADWVNHNVFKIPLRSIVKVRIDFGKSPEQSYEIQSIGNRKFDLIRLQDNSKITNYDTLRLLEELASFRNINFEALLDDMPSNKIDSLQKLIPIRTVSVTTLDQKTKSIRMYRRPNFDNKPDVTGLDFPYDMDRMYAFVDGIEHPVTVQYFVIDNISRPLSFILGQQQSKELELKGFSIGNAPN